MSNLTKLVLAAAGVALLCGAGLYTNGMPTVPPSGAYVPWNGLTPGSGVVPFTYQSELGGYETLGADTNTPGGPAPQTVSATTFQVGAIGSAAGANVVTVTTGAASDNSLIGTLKAASVTITAGSSYTVTLTNTSVTATSNVQAAVYLAAVAGTVQLVSVTPAAGSVVIVVKNIGTASITTGTILIPFQVR